MPRKKAGFAGGSEQRCRGAARARGDGSLTLEAYRAKAEAMSVPGALKLMACKSYSCRSAERYFAMGPGASNRMARPFRKLFRCGEPLGGDWHPPVLIEALQASGVACVRGFHALQIGLPCGAADRCETTRADGIYGSVLLHTMGELEVYKLICSHWGDLCNHGQELQITAVVTSM